MMQSRRQLLVAGLMAGGAAMTLAVTPSVKSAEEVDRVDLEKIFPADFGDWRIDDSVVPILPDPGAQGLLNEIYNQVLSRTYVNDDGKRIMFVVAYGGDQSDGLHIHRPEVCYSAQGFRIRDITQQEISLSNSVRVPVKQLDTARGIRQEPVTYWMRVGDHVVLDTFDRKLAQLAFGLHRTVPDGVLVRVSSISSDKAAAFRLQERFAADMAGALDDDGVRFIAGSRAAALS